jgi:hypothetical protein
MGFYGYLYRSRTNLARSKNNKLLYELLWLYGFYAALDRFPQNKQVLLMYTEVVVTIFRLLPSTPAAYLTLILSCLTQL